MQAPDRTVVPPYGTQGRPTRRKPDIMRSTALKILRKGADAFPVAREATK